MNLRNYLTGMHQMAGGNSAYGIRTFSFGKYISNTADWTNLFSLNVTSLPAQFNIGFQWTSNSMRDSGNAENYLADRTGIACFNGYSFSDWGSDNGWTSGNGINNGGALNGSYNAIYIRDYAWASSPVYVSYVVDVLCNNWDKINVNYY